MKAKYIFFLVLSSLMLCCSSTKTAATPEQIQLLEELVAARSFEIKSDWAYPQTSSGLIALQNSGLIAPGSNVSRISLNGNSNFLKLSDETIDSYLPYFGERQMVNNRSDSGGIELEDSIKDYEVEKQDNNSYIIKFKAKSHNENYNVVLRLYPNLRSEMLLKGAKRFPIRYTGYVSAISE